MRNVPKHIYQFEDAKELNDRVSNPIGSGPYVFDHWDVGYEVDAALSGQTRGIPDMTIR